MAVAAGNGSWQSGGLNRRHRQVDASRRAAHKPCDTFQPLVLAQAEAAVGVGAAGPSTRFRQCHDIAGSKLTLGPAIFGRLWRPSASPAGAGEGLKLGHRNMLWACLAVSTAIKAGPGAVGVQRMLGGEERTQVFCTARRPPDQKYTWMLVGVCCSAQLATHPFALLTR